MTRKPEAFEEVISDYDEIMNEIIEYIPLHVLHSIANRMLRDGVIKQDWFRREKYPDDPSKMLIPIVKQGFVNKLKRKSLPIIQEET